MPSNNRTGKERVDVGFWYQKKEKVTFFQPEEKNIHEEIIAYKCKHNKFKVLKFYDHKRNNRF